MPAVPAFPPGTQKFILKGVKRYAAYVRSLGARRFSRRHFKTASAALVYALRCQERIARLQAIQALNDAKALEMAQAFERLQALQAAMGQDVQAVPAGETHVPVQA